MLSDPEGPSLERKRSANPRMLFIFRCLRDGWQLISSHFSKGLLAKLFKMSWLPPRDSNPDMLIQSQDIYSFCIQENKGPPCYHYMYHRLTMPLSRRTETQNDTNACLIRTPYRGGFLWRNEAIGSGPLAVCIEQQNPPPAEGEDEGSFTRSVQSIAIFHCPYL